LVANLVAWTADLWAEKRAVRLVDRWAWNWVESSAASKAELLVERRVVMLDFYSAVNLAVSKAGQKGVLRADCSVGHWDGSSAGHSAAQRAATRAGCWADPRAARLADHSAELRVEMRAARTDARKVDRWACRLVAQKVGGTADLTGVLLVRNWAANLAVWTADLWVEERAVHWVAHSAEHLVESLVASTAALSADRKVVSLDMYSAVNLAFSRAGLRVFDSAGRLVVRTAAPKAEKRADQWAD